MLIKKMNHFILICVSVVFCVTTTTTSSLYAEETNRILNGSPASENQFPYMISLQRLSEIHSATRGHKCGGVLITLQHALTAAICILESDREPMILINPAEYRVFAGSVLLTNDTSTDRVRRIAKATIHPDYETAHTANQRINDIGFIILGSQFSANTVTPLSVADIGLTEAVPCILSGWGMRSSSATVANTQLMFAQMLSVDQNNCRLLVDSSLVSTKLCAWAPTVGIIQGAAGCEGDRGGPLMCRDGLAGILIETSDCRTVPLRPQLFTRVSNYTTWINHVVAQPIPELGPEPSTVAPPTTTATPGTSPGPPSGATTYQPIMAVLLIIIIAQVLIKPLKP